MTTDKAPATANDHLMIDVLHRMRSIEQNIPPRVQLLESAVTDIQKEFQTMRSEQGEQAKETRASIDAFGITLQRYDADHSEDRKEVSNALERLSTKISFATGAFWAASGLFGIAAVTVYNWQSITDFLNAVAPGVTP